MDNFNENVMCILKWIMLTLFLKYDRKSLLQSVLIKQFVPSIFGLCFAFTDINFRGMLHHVCDVAYVWTKTCANQSELVNVGA